MPVRVFDDRDLGLVREVLQSGHLSILDGGQLTPRFQTAFAEAHGAKHGVAMNAAMSVLHASIISAGAGTGDEVICDPVCVFGAMATMYANAVPVFVDVDPVTWNMNPDAIEERITERTKALIVTHVCGLPAEIDRIVEVAHRHDVIVIEDCAHALLTRYKGKCVGTWGDIGSFSFQASKQMGLGDGGMALTDNDELAAKLNLHAGAPTFMAVAYGMHYNYRMSEPVAAIGIAQLERLPGYIEGLRRAAALLDAAVADCAFIDLQRGPAEAEHSFHLWGATFHGERTGLSREDFARVLEEEQVGIGMGYTNIPAYRHPLIAERMGSGRGCPLDCPLYGGTGNQYPDGLCPKVEALFPNIMLGYPFQPDEAVAAQADRLHRAVERLA